MEYVGLSFMDILRDILTVIFDNILVPVIQDVASILIGLAGALIEEILSDALLLVFVFFLRVINLMEGFFDIFSGVTPVTVSDASEQMSLLNYFFQIGEVKTALLSVTIISVVLAFLATMVAVGRSMSDMALENKNPISQVLRQSGKAAVTFMIIPFSCLFILHMATQLTALVSNSLVNTNGKVSMSDVIFVACAGEALEGNASIEEFSQNQQYQDIDKVKQNFDIKKINYIMALVSTLLVTIIMVCAILQFIRRIFEVLLLYVLSPLFVSTMPLDGGARFREWKNLFVAKMFSAFGPILMMKLYFAIIPLLTSGEVAFSLSRAWMEQPIRLFLVIGGAYAVFKSQHLMTAILDPSAAGAAAESGFLASALTGKITGTLGRMGNRTVRSGTAGSSAGQYQTQSQVYTGK